MAGAFFISSWFDSFALFLILFSLAGVVIMQGTVERSKISTPFNVVVSAHKSVIFPFMALTYCAFASELVLLALHQDFDVAFPALVTMFTATSIIIYLLIKRMRIMTQPSQEQLKKNATSPSSDEHPLFVIYHAKKNSLVLATAFAVSSSIGMWLGYHEFEYSFVMCAASLPLMYAILYSWFRLVSPKLEFFERHFREAYGGRIRSDVQYSDVSSVEIRAKGIILYGRDDNVLGVVRENPRRSEIGLLSDWLIARTRTQRYDT